MIRVNIFNVRYSENLGDGILAVCLERELAKHKGLEVITTDLAGRTDYAQGGGRRAILLRRLAMLPAWPRGLAMKLLLMSVVQLSLASKYRLAMSGTDAVVLGGGNLISDIELNFPLKISKLISTARRAGVPVHVFGVGVGAYWSKVGGRLLLQALSSSTVSSAAVRDEESQGIWEKRIEVAGGVGAALCRDPAVLAYRVFKIATPSPSSRLVGLNITAPAELSSHGDRSIVDTSYTVTWWHEVCDQAWRQGLTPVLFTNGSTVDEEFLASVFKSMPATLSIKVQIVPPARQPTELVNTIARFQSVLGHRMHAHITAYSLKIPTVGLSWDRKLTSFFSSVGRGSFVLDHSSVSATQAINCVMQAIEQGIDEALWRKAVADSEQEIANLANTIVRIHEAKRDGIGQ